MLIWSNFPCTENPASQKHLTQGNASLFSSLFFSLCLVDGWRHHTCRSGQFSVAFSKKQSQIPPAVVGWPFPPAPQEALSGRSAYSQSSKLTLNSCSKKAAAVVVASTVVLQSNWPFGWQWHWPVRGWNRLPLRVFIQLIDYKGCDGEHSKQNKTPQQHEVLRTVIFGALPLQGTPSLVY